MKQPSIIKNYLYDALYHVMTFFIPLITTPYLARVLRPEGVGTFSYILSIQTYFSMMAALGTVTYGARVIAQCRDDKGELSKNFWEIEILTILTSVVTIVLWLIICWINKGNRTYFLILTINILATTFDISWFFSGLELFKTLSIRNCFFKVLGTVLIFTFVNSSDDLILYFLIYSSIALGSSLSLWLSIRKYVDFIPLQLLKLKKHFKETLIYFLPTVATSIYTVLDKTLIGIIVKNPNENGFYEQANQIVNIAKTITFGSINTVMGTRLSYLFSKGKNDELKQKLQVAVDFVFFLGYGIMFGVMAVADDLVLLYFGEGYDSVVNLLYCLMPVLIIISISSCLGTQYYIPVGKRLVSAKYLIYGSLINLFMNIILIPRMMSLGACIATVIAELVITILYIRGCEGVLTYSDIWIKSWKKIVSGIIMCVVITITCLYLKNFDLIGRFVIKVMVGGICYVCCLGFFKDDTLNLFFRLMKSKLKGK